MSIYSVANQLLTLLLNSKNGEELPVISGLPNTGKVIVYDATTGLISTILKTNLFDSAGGGTPSFNKYALDISNNGQTSFTLGDKPDNIDLVIGRVNLVQGVDYSYNNQTGVLILTAAINTNTLTVVSAYNNAFSKKQDLTISSIGQSEFYLNDLPKYINIVLNRACLIENEDYTYAKETGLLTIINDDYIDQITLNSIMDIRKIF